MRPECLAKRVAKDSSPYSYQAIDRPVAATLTSVAAGLASEAPERRRRRAACCRLGTTANPATTARSGQEGAKAPGPAASSLRGASERTSGVRLRSRCASAAVRRCLEGTADGLCHIRRRKIGRRSSSTSPGGVPVVRLASPAPTPWRSSKPWPPNALARSPREGRLVLEPRAREGDRPLVRAPPTRGEAG